MATVKVIQQIWSRHLSVELSPDDDLFDSGADSVMTLNVQLEAENILQKQVPTCKLMENPTIAGWAAIFDDPKSTARCS